MNKKILCVGMALVMGAAFAVIAFAQDKPEVLVKQRQAAMTLQGKYFGPLGAMAQGKIPYNAEVVTRNAAFLNALDKMPWDGFTPATKDLKSQTLPAAFNDPAKFKIAQERLQEVIAKLVEVKSGNEAAGKAAITEVGKACGGCHDNFREKS